MSDAQDIRPGAGSAEHRLDGPAGVRGRARAGWGEQGYDAWLGLALEEARAVGTSISDGLYVRIVDVQAALAARQYAAGVDLVIEVDDPILPDNTARYRIVTDGDPEGSSAEVTSSNSITSGSIASARPRSTRFCRP